MKRPFALLSVTAALLAGCATKPVAVAVAPPPILAPTPVAAMPKGAFPGMVIPAMLPDGSYPTPNRALTPAATVWHLRAALNVAALACRSSQEAAIIAGYNSLLAAQKPTLVKAEATYAAEYRAGGGDWQDRYDDSMTRLYNFFSQSPARDAFCAAAGSVLADAATVPADGLAAFAATRLAMLEQPFTDFYRAYDAWRGAATRPLPARTAIYASNATVATAPGPVLVSVPVPPAQPYRAPPRIEVDPSVFQ